MTGTSRRLMKSAHKETAKTPSSASVQTLPDRQTDTTTQASIEPRLGHDFRHIPLHATQTAALQTKLAVSQPGDVYEQEADQVADQVMRNSKPEPALIDERGEANISLARKPSTASGGTAAVSETSSQVHPVLSSEGQPLDAETQAFMEPRFGHDFSKVRIHADERAAESARSLNALAYTVGQDIVFGEGQYAPGTSVGKRLLAHELTHTLQQQPAEEINRTAGAEPALTVSGPLVQREADVAEPDSTEESTTETSEESTTETSKSIADMTPTERLVAALKQAWIHLGPELSNAIKSMMSEEALATAIGLFVVSFLASQFTPIGWAVDLGIAAISGIFMAKSLFEAIKHLINFFEARNATTPEEIDQAGAEFAAAVTEIGVDTLMLLVMHKLGKATKDGGSGPSEGPPPNTAVAVAVTAEGRLVPILADTIPPLELKVAGARSGAAAAGSMMMSATKDGGSSGPGKSSARTFKKGEVEWVPEDAHMGPDAKAYNDGAEGAHSDIATRKQLAPAINYIDANGEVRRVKFDGQNGNVMIDRKRGVTTFPKTYKQAERQSEALKQNGFTGVWEVPNQATAKVAQKVLDSRGIKNITVKVVPEP
jgi:hypothetical protein